MPNVPLHHASHGPPPRTGEDCPSLPPSSLQCTRAIPSQATSAVAYVAPPPEDDDPLLAFAPYLHPAPRKRSITPDVQRAFIAQLAATGVVRQAARHVGRSLEALYRLRHKPGAEGFSAAWDAALERGMTRLEDCALERAMQGVSTPIVSHGKILGWWDKPDNNLLRFLLQHRMAGTYGMQKLVPGHPIYESIKVQVLAEIEANKPDEDEILEGINAKLEKMRERQLAAEAREDYEGERWLTGHGRGSDVSRDADEEDFAEPHPQPSEPLPCPQPRIRQP